LEPTFVPGQFGSQSIQPPPSTRSPS
jgi:hypothetical protein